MHSTLLFCRLTRSLAILLCIALPVIGVVELLLRQSSYSGVRDRCAVEPTAARPWPARCVKPHLVHWSAGAALQLRTVDRVNSAGYINDEEYASASSPLLAVVGDSFVDGIGVGFPASCGGRLQSALAPGRRVYTFSASGSPLSQYVRWIQEARFYRPDWYAVLIVSNDIDESVYDFATGVLPSGSVFWSRYHWVESGRPSLRSTLSFRHSSHLLLETYLYSSFPGFRYPALLLANARLAVDPAFPWRRLAYHRWAAGPEPLVRAAGFGRIVISAFLRDLAAAVPLPADRIAIVLTHITSRPLSAPNVHTRAWMIWRRQFSVLARAAGHEVIDLEPLLRKEWRRRGGTIDLSPHDGHWPAWGHRICAEAVLQGSFLTTPPLFHF